MEMEREGEREREGGGGGCRVGCTVDVGCSRTAVP